MNPYLLADQRQAKARWAQAPMTERLLPLLPLVAALVVLPLLRESLYFFLDNPRIVHAGVRELLLRLGLGLAAALALSTFSALVRGPDRGVVDLHPLRAGDWLFAKLRGLAWGRLLWLGVAMILLVPLRENLPLVGVSAILLGGAWVAGLGLGVGVNLLAPGVGRSPAWAGVLDAVRGVNPRMQAALLYAPGVALIGAGLPVGFAAAGVEQWLDGEPIGLLWLVPPYLIGVLGFWMAWRGRGELAAIGAVLGEVEAAWAQVEDPAEQRRVYMDWLVPRLPKRLQLPILKDLRQGWRSFRATLTGSWAMAALAGLSGWSDGADSVARTSLIAVVGVAMVGGLGLRMAAADPPWLGLWLPLPRLDRALSRAGVLFVWSQPIVLLPALTMGIRQGGIPIFVALELRTLILALLGLACSVTGWARWLYLPLALLVILWGV